jgi:hypothetical protein
MTYYHSSTFLPPTFLVYLTLSMLRDFLLLLAVFALCVCVCVCVCVRPRVSILVRIRVVINNPKIIFF